VAMIPLCGGALLSSMEEVNFSWAGFSLSVMAMLLRALRSVLQGRLLVEDRVDSVTLCYYMAPFNLMLFAFASAVLEGLGPQRALASIVTGGWEENSDKTSSQQDYKLVLALTFSAFLACCFNVASYLTIRYLSVIGSAVIQNGKTPATILLSVLIFGNAITPVQILGFGITFFGVLLHGQKGKLEVSASK
ncbi:unnamed protein product, partial [Polarella glacialis]